MTAATVHTGRHRKPRPALDLSKVGDAVDEAKQEFVVFLAAVLFIAIDAAIGFALVQVSPILGLLVAVGLAAGIGWLLHRMRRPSDE